MVASNFHDGSGRSQRPYSLRRREAAQAISVSVASLDRATRKGLIKYVKLNGVKLYPVKELERFLGNHAN